MEELEILETMKKDLEENMKRLESRIKELRETIEKRRDSEKALWQLAYFRTSSSGGGGGIMPSFIKR